MVEVVPPFLLAAIAFAAVPTTATADPLCYRVAIERIDRVEPYATVCPPPGR